MTLNTGRFTTRQNEGITVFIIGMRINDLWRVKQWLPVLTAFPKMIKELEENKNLGYMSSELFFTGKTILSVQYWASSEALFNYAKGPKHLLAWRTFNKRIRKAKGVALYHETHIVPPKQSEAIYINMPEFGMGKALGTEEVTREINTASQRLNRDQ